MARAEMDMEMEMTISATLQPCLKSFNQIRHQIEQGDYEFEADVPSALWIDELGRLRIWAANIGAHQTRQSSLEFRLRDASHIKQQVLSLLGDLSRTLIDVLEETAENSSETADVDDEMQFGSDDLPASEVKQLYEDVVNIVDCLYQLSMLIRKPAQHDLWSKSHRDASAAYEPFDKEHVQNKYPNADIKIIERLGRAITRKRKYLKYRERHRAKLGKGIERSDTDIALSETIATDLDADCMRLEEISSYSGVSQTSYATSLFDGGSITVPRMPKEWAAGKPIECPYCYFLVDIDGSRSWTRHIFKDLKPYICTFADCDTPERVYDSRREWFIHMQTCHRSFMEHLNCPLCKESLKSQKLLERHLARHLEELALFALPKSAIDDDSSTEGEHDVAKSSSLRRSSLEGLDSGTSDEDQEAIHKSERDSRSSECTDELLAAEFGWKADEEIKNARLKDKLQDTTMSQDQNPDRTETGFLADERMLATSEDNSPESSELPPAAQHSSTDRELVSHERSYVCEELECHNLPGFNYSGGLLRHQREVHGKYGSPEAPTQDGSSNDESVDQVTVHKAVYDEAFDNSTSENLNFRPKKQHLTGQERQAKSIADEEYGRRVRKDLKSAGYDDKEIEDILTKTKKQHGNEEDTDIRRPTYLKVHRMYLSEETLDIYDLPWKLDDHDHNYIIIKRWLPDNDQEILFEHTKKLRERKKLVAQYDESVGKKSFSSKPQPFKKVSESRRLSL